MDKRAKYLEDCAGFGVDKDGNPGIDMSTEECQACQKEDEKMWEACNAECEKGEKGDKPSSDNGENGEGDTAMPKKKNKTKKVNKKQAKAEKPKAKGKEETRVDAFVALVLDKTLRTRQEFAEAIAAAIPKYTAKQVISLVSQHLRFCRDIGVMEVNDQKQYVLK